MHHVSYSCAHAARIVLSSLLLLSCSKVYSDSGDTQIAEWYGNAASAYTLTLDDCRPSQISDVEPAWTSRGLVGTFFINASDDIYYWRVYKDDYLGFPSRGHELASHTLNHYSVIPNDPSYPDYQFHSLDELDQDCREFAAVMQDLTGLPTVSFAYPFGQDDADSRAVIASHYLSARDVSGMKDVNGRFVPNPASPPDMHDLDCFLAAGENAWWPGHDFGDYDTASTLFTAYVDDTIDAGGWGIEYSHGISEGDRINHDAYFEHLDYVMDRVAEGVVWNGTQGDVARYIYSRDAANVELVACAPDEIQLIVDDGLDDVLFNVPLTVLTEIPRSWSDASLIPVYQNNEATTARVFEEGGILFAAFEAAADGTPVCLRPQFSSDPLAGDLNGDGCVGSADLDIVRCWWGANVSPGDLACGDASGDGCVNSVDLDLLRLQWEMGLASVPEPGIALFLLLGAAFLTARRL